MVSVISHSKQLVTFLFFGVLLLNCFTEFGSYAQNLAAEEVEVLKSISTKLKYLNWNINETFCRDVKRFNRGSYYEEKETHFACNCSRQNGTVDHITIIRLKGLNLNGVLLPEFAKLTCLQELDLTHNYISGSIPPSFGQLPLVKLFLSRNRLSGAIPKEIGDIGSLQKLVLSENNCNGTIPESFGKLKNLTKFDLGRNYIDGSIPSSFGRLPLVKLFLQVNRLSGAIPKEIGDIASLEELVLEDNQLDEPLHENLGNLRNLRRLVLSGNNCNGTIPKSFRNLKNLTELISGTKISGKIPNFIGNWTKLKRLDIQGTSMEGPIPPTIPLLTNLIELRISDLNGSTTMTFPNLQKLIYLEYLVLRNCLITGSIPYYIWSMENMLQLDLSFNMLNGTIDTFGYWYTPVFVFLTNNSLSGRVPYWILNSRYYIDISYNNFSAGSSDVSCDVESSVNMLSNNYSSLGSNSNRWCLKKDFPCSSKAQNYKLFINCGGNITKYEGNEYQEDSQKEGPSHFSSYSEEWAYSSTGISTGTDTYIADKPLSSLNMTDPSSIYQTARVSPLSLKYYGLCLRKGSYEVKLHFAEIMFSNDQTFSSLGKRIFDVSIQGKLVLKDFNIMEAARGAGKGIYKEFNVLVNGSTLEIHIYWAGKGTTSIPYRGVYGPLISAIAVTPNFKVDTGGLSIGTIVGIVASSCVVIVLILVLLRMKGYLGGKKLEDNELRGLDLKTGYFTLRQIKAATNNFDLANKIGEGGFGPVYKGVLSDGAIIAVKQLSSKSRQGNREFINEIGMISALQHPNLVKLYGCSIEGNQLLVIYEYMENNSLARALFGHEEHLIHLDWPARKKICLGIAKGLAYLHEESRLKIVHRDIKATNVLLDKDLNAKISDFGLAKLDDEENTHISTRIAGTIGYMAPEYAMRGYLTDKADVYSFGVVVLEIFSGKSNTSYRPKEEFVYLMDWAYVQQEQGNLLELVDPSLGSNYSSEEVMRMLNLSLLCTNPSPSLRPSMSSIVSMLEGKSAVQAPIIKRRETNQDARFKAFENLTQDSQTHISTFSNDNQLQRDMSNDGPSAYYSLSLQSKDEIEPRPSFIKQASSIHDFYDVNLE